MEQDMKLDQQHYAKSWTSDMGVNIYCKLIHIISSMSVILISTYSVKHLGIFHHSNKQLCVNLRTNKQL